MKEIFVKVPDYPFSERYSISNYGRIRVDRVSKYSNNKTKYLKLGYSKKYTYVWLTNNGIQKSFDIHRLVARAFLGEPVGDKKLACHLDDDRRNNRVDNLVWGSTFDNMRHMVDHKRSLVGVKHPNSKLDDDKVRSIRELYSDRGLSQTELAKLYSVAQTTISRVISRQNWDNVL